MTIPPLIYLDHAATSPPLPEVRDEVRRLLENGIADGNPSSRHSFGRQAAELLERSRAAVARTLYARPEEIFFVPSGTLANNIALHGARALAKSGKIIISAAEHPSVYETAEQLRRDGFEVAHIPAREGELDLHALEHELDDNCALVSVMAVNNEHGAEYDVSAVGALLRRRYAGARRRPLLHADAVQAYMRRRLYPEQWGVDLCTVSFHKIGGLRGAAALYVRKGTKLPPLWSGGGQERGLVSGTENTLAVAAGALAAQKWDERFDEWTAYMRTLREYLSGAASMFGYMHLNEPQAAAPHIASLRVEGVGGEVLMNYLSERGICVSTGSACSYNRKKAAERSRALLDFGLDARACDCTVRVSFAPSTKFEEIDELLANIDAIKKKYFSLDTID